MSSTAVQSDNRCNETVLFISVKMLFIDFFFYKKYHKVSYISTKVSDLYLLQHKPFK